MSKSKGIFSLEENQEPLDITNDIEPIESDLLDMSELAAESEEIMVQAEQAEVVQDALTEMDAAATPEEQVTIATEAMLSIVGYKSKNAFSLESYNASLDKNLNLAQESILGKAVNFFDKLTTTKSKLEKRINAGLAKLKENGTRDDIIEDAAFAKDLYKLTSTKEFTANDGKTLFKAYEDSLNSSDVKSFTDAGIVFDKVMGMGVIVNNDKKPELEKAINTYGDKMDSLHDKIVTKADKLTKNSSSREGGNFKPLEYSDAKSLVDEVNKIKSNTVKIVTRYGSIVSAGAKEGKAEKDKKVSTEGYSDTEIFDFKSFTFWLLFIFFPFYCYYALARLALNGFSNTKKKDNPSTEGYSDNINTVTISRNALEKASSILKALRNVEKEFLKSEFALCKYIEASAK